MDRTLQTIVVATSLTEADDPVVETGLAIAAQCGAKVELVHAYALPIPYVGLAPAEVALQPDYEPIEQLCRDRLADQLRRLGGDVELAATAWLDVGSPHRVVLEAADERGADLILVGPHAGSRTLARWLGSTADRVLRKAHVPVWVARGGAAPLPRSVLAPVDLSDLSKHCLERGLALLHEALPEEFPTVEALFVMSRVDREGGVNFTPEQVDRFALEELKRFVTDLKKPAGVKIEPRMEIGLPREEIHNDLDRYPVDLVVLGTHGRSGFERLMLGSVAADVVREASCSVLVTPPVVTQKDSEARALDPLGKKKSRGLLLSEAIGPASRGLLPST